MRTLSILLVLCFAQPVSAQSEHRNDKSDCTQIGDIFYMCDPQNGWMTLELPEDLQGVGLTYPGGIEAQIDVMASPWVGIQVRAQRYGGRFTDTTRQELTKVDVYPAITYITHDIRDGLDVVRATTVLLLYQLNLSAETVQVAQNYTPEHAARHAEMLAGITHEWSFQ